MLSRGRRLFDNHVCAGPRGPLVKLHCNVRYPAGYRCRLRRVWCTCPGVDSGPLIQRPGERVKYENGGRSRIDTEGKASRPRIIDILPASPQPMIAHTSQTQLNLLVGSLLITSLPCSVAFILRCGHLVQEASNELAAAPPGLELEAYMHRGHGCPSVLSQLLPVKTAIFFLVLCLNP